MAAQEIRRRCQRVCLGADHVDAAIAVAICTIAQDIHRKELRLADLAMHGAHGIGSKRAIVDQASVQH